MTSLELWGGVECTVNRVRDRYGSLPNRKSKYASTGPV